MKLTPPILIIVAFAFFIQCKPPSERIAESFRTVNKSLERSYRVNSIQPIYLSIDSNRHNNKTLASKADSIFNITENSLNFIDSIKQILELQDTIGTDTDLATKVFINSTTGDILKNKLLDVYYCSYSTIIDDAIKPELDSALNIIADLKNDKT